MDGVDRAVNLTVGLAHFVEELCLAFLGELASQRKTKLDARTTTPAMTAPMMTLLETPDRGTGRM